MLVYQRVPLDTPLISLKDEKSVYPGAPGAPAEVASAAHGQNRLRNWHEEIHEKYGSQ